MKRSLILKTILAEVSGHSIATVDDVYEKFVNSFSYNSADCDLTLEQADALLGNLRNNIDNIRQLLKPGVGKC